MTLELTAIPLAFIAGILGIMSPCVWPLVPVVMSSAATGGRTDPWFLALGLATAFSMAGTLLTFIMLNLGLHTDALRFLAAAMLIAVALILLIKPLEHWISVQLSALSNRFNGGSTKAGSNLGQFGVGALLGLVWLPCVGPTLGAAIALASMGENMVMAFAVMFTFGTGTAMTLLFAGLLSRRLLNRLRPGILENAARGKKLLGWLLLILGSLVLTGLDKILETWAVNLLPAWVTNL